MRGGLIERVRDCTGERERESERERQRQRDWSEGTDGGRSSPFLLAVREEAPSSAHGGKWHWLCAVYNVYRSFTAQKPL